MTETQAREQDVVDILTTDHREAISLIEEIRTTTEKERQRDLADVLIAEIVRHSVAEETVVYPAIRQHLENGEESVNHDIEEHKEIETTLKELEDVDPEQGSFITTVEKLQSILEHHVEDEETHQFPSMREQIPGDELVKLGKAVEAIKLVSPTRPHPSAPNAQLFHLTAGPGVGLVDRLKDKLSGRPTSPEDLS